MVRTFAMLAFLVAVPALSVLQHPDILRMKKGKLTPHTQPLDDVSRYASYLTCSTDGATLSGKNISANNAGAY